MYSQAFSDNAVLFHHGRIEWKGGQAQHAILFGPTLQYSFDNAAWQQADFTWIGQEAQELFCLFTKGITHCGTYKCHQNFSKGLRVDIPAGIVSPTNFARSPLLISVVV